MFLLKPQVFNLGWIQKQPVIQHQPSVCHTDEPQSGRNSCLWLFYLCWMTGEEAITGCHLIGLRAPPPSHTNWDTNTGVVGGFAVISSDCLIFDLLPLQWLTASNRPPLIIYNMHLFNVTDYIPVQLSFVAWPMVLLFWWQLNLPSISDEYWYCPQLSPLPISALRYFA